MLTRIISLAVAIATLFTFFVQPTSAAQKQFSFTADNRSYTLYATTPDTYQGCNSPEGDEIVITGVEDLTLRGQVIVEYVIDSERQAIQSYQISQQGDLALTVQYPPISEWPIMDNGTAEIHVDVQIEVYAHDLKLGTIGSRLDWDVFCRNSIPTPTSTATNTPTSTSTATSTATNTPTPTSTATNTPPPTTTATNTPPPTATATNTPPPTATATNTPPPTATATNTPPPSIPCPVNKFVVNAGAISTCDEGASAVQLKLNAFYVPDESQPDGMPRDAQGNILPFWDNGDPREIVPVPEGWTPESARAALYNYAESRGLAHNELTMSTYDINTGIVSTKLTWAQFREIFGGGEFTQVWFEAVDRGRLGCPEWHLLKIAAHWFPCPPTSSPTPSRTIPTPPPSITPTPRTV